MPVRPPCYIGPMKKKKSRAIILHKYFGIILSIALIYVSLSGIFLNHPEVLAGTDTPSWLLPGHMKIKNWSRGSILTGIRLENGDYLTGGKLGVLRFSPDRSKVVEENEGLPESLFRKKVNVLYQDKPNGIIYAGTVSGLYTKPFDGDIWIRHEGVEGEIQSLFELNGRLCAVGKSFAWLKEGEEFRRMPFSRDGKKGMPLAVYTFDLHAGRVLGLFGRLLMDIGGIIMVLLALSGLFKWLVPAGRRLKISARFKAFVYRYHFRHYKKLGLVFLIPLILAPFTGLFMQPPFSALLAGRNVSLKLHIKPWEERRWNDSINHAAVDADGERILVVTGLRTYEGKWDFTETFTPVQSVVPVHPMGATYFGEESPGTYIVGSFSGLLRWDAREDIYRDYFTDESVTTPRLRIPKDGYQVNGLLDFGDTLAVIDYHKGIFDLETGESFFEMPEKYRNRSTFSLWHYLFEIHNGRIWRGMIGGFYIFHTMVTSISAILIIWTGLHIMLVIRKRKKKTRVLHSPGAEQEVGEV